MFQSFTIFPKKPVNRITCVDVLGTQVHTWTMAETLKFIKYRLDHQLFTQHVVVNVAKIVNMWTDQPLKRSVESSDIINIDGAGVVLGGRLLGHHIPERVAGIDLFFELLEMSSEQGYPVYFLGAKDDVLRQATNNIRTNYPALNISGSHHGYFWDDEQAMVEKIRRSGAKLLFVAITSPRKENFINKWKDELGVDFVMGVGGTFDIVAGKTKRAPVWMQKMALEWLYRLLQEPSRMWKRYLVTNTKFVSALLKERLLRSVPKRFKPAFLK